MSIGVKITDNVNAILPLEDCKTCYCCELRDISYNLDGRNFTTFKCVHEDACKRVTEYFATHKVVDGEVVAE